MNAQECATAAHTAISRVGGAFMVDPGVTASAERQGLSFFEFYVVGRAGVLGRIEAGAACSALRLLAPAAVTTAWARALEQVEPLEAATAYAECNRDWGRRRLAGAPDLDVVVELASTLLTAADLSALPLVAGWRAMAAPSESAAHAAHLLQTLREYRGALHALAVAEAGLSPVEAIVSGPDGAERAAQLGWPGPFPNAAPFAERRAEAERRTDELAAQPYATLNETGRAEFVRVTGALLDRIRRPVS